ncbi:MAG: hypothetical protein ACYCQI_08845 [Gammaproteobacteria bacterium]
MNTRLPVVVAGAIAVTAVTMHRFFFTKRNTLDSSKPSADLSTESKAERSEYTAKELFSRILKEKLELGSWLEYLIKDDTFTLNYASAYRDGGQSMRRLEAFSACEKKFKEYGLSVPMEKESNVDRNGDVSGSIVIDLRKLTLAKPKNDISNAPKLFTNLSTESNAELSDPAMEDKAISEAAQDLRNLTNELVEKHGFVFEPESEVVFTKLESGEYTADEPKPNLSTRRLG